MTYSIRTNKFNWRSLEPENNFKTEEYIRDHYDLYLTTEHITDEHKKTRRYFRLNANKPHTIEMALAYDVKCPVCRNHVMKQVGRCQDSHKLGLYRCPVCDKD